MKCVASTQFFLWVRSKKKKKKVNEVPLNFQGVEKPQWYQMCSSGSAELRHQEVGVGTLWVKRVLKTLCSLKTEIGTTESVKLFFWPPELSSLGVLKAETFL